MRRLSLAVAAALAVGVGAGVLVAGRDEEPAPAAVSMQDAVEVVAVGDLACAPGDPPTEQTCRHADTARTAVELDPDAVLLLGDVQYPDGSEDAFTTDGGYTGTWSALHDRTWPAPGNHEWETEGAAGYRAVFDDRTGGRWWYSRDVGEWHVVSLTTDCEQVGGCEAGSEQHAWLLEDLAAHEGRPTVLFWHHPRWSHGQHGPDDAVDDLWRTAVEDRDVQLVLAGHQHAYERFAPLDAEGERDDDGLRQLVVGTGGHSQYCDEKDDGPDPEVFECGVFGVLRLLLAADGYRWELVSTDGDVVDEGTAPLRS